MKKLSTSLSVLAVAGGVFGVSSLVRSADRTPVRAEASVDRSAAGAIARAERSLAANPDDVDALALLATSALTRMKETADSSWYNRSEEAATRALAIDPTNVPALDAKATLANARHRFPDAIAPATASLKHAPDRFAPLEILTDANVELGRYPTAFALAEKRLALRPDMASYSRASYAAELRGERDRATQLMELAADSARRGTADRAWALTHVGLLRFGSGDIVGAEKVMRQALLESPGDSTALAGLAKVVGADGRLDESAKLFRESLDGAQVAPVAAELAGVEAARGNQIESEEALALAHKLDAREAANGVELELDAALVDADFRVPTADDVAKARRGHSIRTGVVGDDALGWVLTRSGRCDEGLRFARRSLRLGTQDALTFFHAGMAAKCAGEPNEAVTYLRKAIALNPRFSVRWSPVAAKTLDELTVR